MQFVAHYINRTAPQEGVKSEYYRTVWAENINEAMKNAGRYTRKNHLLHTITEQQGKD